MDEKQILDQDYMNALFTIHQGLPRGGPGTDEATRLALAMLPALPKKTRVLDLGCGPGRQTMVLAESLGVRITAVDLFQGFLDYLKEQAAERGLAHLIHAVNADMAGLQYAPHTWDLVWSEGAVYLVGFEAGLKMIRPWLAPGGWVVVSEACWFREDRPPEAVEFWRGNYPDMKSVPDNLRTAQQAGYDVAGHFLLSRDDWWRDYYAPMTPRLKELEIRAANDPALRFALAETHRERALFEKYHEYYGYAFFLLKAR